MRRTHSWLPGKDRKRKEKGENGMEGDKAGGRKEGLVQKEGRKMEGRQSTPVRTGVKRI